MPKSIKKKPKIELNNDGSPNAGHSLYFPRLMVNKKGEIILAYHRHKSGLTSGILVGLTPDAERTKLIGGKKPLPIGIKFTDWEVAGELEDYDGEVTVIFKNRAKNSLPKVTVSYAVPQVVKGNGPDIIIDDGRNHRRNA